MSPELPEPTEDHAGEVRGHALRWAASLGYESVVNDPFFYRRGLITGLTLQVAPVFEVGVDGTWFPILGNIGSRTKDPDWRPNMALFCPENGSCSPDISKIDLSVRVSARYYALLLTLCDRLDARLGVFAGLGVVHTVDDYLTLQVDPYDPDYDSTAVQWHPSTPIGAAFDLRVGRAGIRLRLERSGYIEVINGGTLEMKLPLSVGAEALAWW